MEKFAKGESFSNSRELVKFLNNNNIPQEDIVAVFEVKGQVILIYYQ